jgi:hypothetical protein
MLARDKRIKELVKHETSKIGPHKHRGAYQKCKSMPGVAKKNPVLPTNDTGLDKSSPPYASAYPIDQKASAPPALSSKFHRRTFATFFSRIDPARSMANPTCMKKTRAPAKRR